MTILQRIRNLVSKPQVDSDQDEAPPKPKYDTVQEMYTIGCKFDEKVNRYSVQVELNSDGEKHYFTEEKHLYKKELEFDHDPILIPDDFVHLPDGVLKDILYNIARIIAGYKKD